MGFTESKKQQVSTRRKRTGCPKDKIQPPVSPLVVKCQGLGKFSSMLGSKTNSHACEHYLPPSSALLQPPPPPPQPAAHALAGVVQEPRTEQLSVSWGSSCWFLGLPGCTDGGSWRLAWGQHGLLLGIEAPPSPNSQI